MDFLKKLATESTGNTNTTTTESKGSSEQSQSPSQSELLSSAQVVAGAARATLQKEPNKVDNSKVAGAAADLLDAAETYGKLDTTTGIGSYVEKAQNYLHQYETSHSTTAAPPPATATTTTTKAEAGEPAAAKAPPAADTKEGLDESPAAATEHAAKSEGGIGGYVKMAEGLLNKEGSESKSGDSEGGYGDMMKKAGDFLKKK